MRTGDSGQLTVVCKCVPVPAVESSLIITVLSNYSLSTTKMLRVLFRSLAPDEIRRLLPPLAEQITTVEVLRGSKGVFPSLCSLGSLNSL